MKKTGLFILVALLISCKLEPKKTTENIATKIEPISEEVLETAVIYEANIRQYSKEGTFEAFTKDIPQLKELGVKIIWLMPIFPISETKRKATGDKFVHELPKEEQAKYLGSYYAVSDFKKINPEFGTIKDFRNLIKVAHENEMYVILDWVPNHTGWDHTWIKRNPEFYTKNAKGEITEPLNEDGTPVGWADVADLNYDNKNLRKTMVKDMLYWIEKENIDGFRCDVVGSVPLSFWQEAIPKLREKKKIFMLAEAWEPELLKDNLFDMAYGWDTHHRMNDLAKKEDISIWNTHIQKMNTMYEPNDMLMNFVTNHDENSWNGTIAERMGNAWQLYTALSYTIKGMPLIYSGQEYGLNHRLKFFEKDEIPHTKGKEWELLKKLGKLKNNNPALNGGKNPASYIKINTQNNQVLAFKRQKEDNSIVFIANVSKQEQTIIGVISGKYLNYMKGETINLPEQITLQPFEYMILVR